MNYSHGKHFKITDKCEFQPCNFFISCRTSFSRNCANYFPHFQEEILSTAFHNFKALPCSLFHNFQLRRLVELSVVLRFFPATAVFPTQQPTSSIFGLFHSALHGVAGWGCFITLFARCHGENALREMHLHTSKATFVQIRRDITVGRMWPSNLCKLHLKRFFFLFVLFIRWGKNIKQEFADWGFCCEK